MLRLRTQGRRSRAALAALALAASLPASAAAPAKGALDEVGVESDDLAANPAALELREVRALAAKAASGADGASATPARPQLSLAAMGARYDIPIAYNARVSKWLSFFQGNGRRFFTVWLARAQRWGPAFREILHSYGAPRDLLYLAMVESGLSMQAVSSARAAGPWQFMEATGEEYGLRVNFWVDERLDPVKATHAAALYLRALHSKHKDWYLAWAEYNAGPGNVNRAIAQRSTADFWALADAGALPRETQDYVPTIIAAALIAKHPDLFDFAPPGTAPIAFDVVDVAEPTDLAVLAECARTTEATLRELNPELLHFVTPPIAGGAYELRVPKGSAAHVRSCIFPPQRFSYRGCRVRRGESIRTLAQRVGADPLGIVQVNRLEGRVRVGQELVIPLPRGATASRP